MVVTRIIRLLCLIVGLLSIAFSATADSLDTELTVFGAYRFGGTFDVQTSDAAYEMQDSSSFGVIWDRRYEANTQWELFYSQQRSEVEISQPAGIDPIVDVDLYTLQLGGTYLGEGEKVRPYLAATIGGTHIKAESSGSKSDTFWSGSIGLGIKLSPNSRIGIRLEARAHAVLMNNSTDLFCRTGPDLNVCAISVEGDLFNQVETFAGVVVRF